MRKCICTCCLAFIMAACGNNSEDGATTVQKAHIFERKTLPGNKLLVSYTYQKGQTLVKDSSIVDNVIIEQDSVPVNLLVKK